LCPQSTHGYAYSSLLQTADQAALRLYGNDHAGPRKVMERLEAACAGASHAPEELMRAIRLM
jgi:hypothetical protein